MIGQGLLLGQIRYYGIGPSHEVRMSKMVQRELRRNFLANCLRQTSQEDVNSLSDLCLNPDIHSHRLGYATESIIKSLRSTDCFESVAIEPEFVAKKL
jgi:hypothetical protein